MHALWLSSAHSMKFKISCKAVFEHMHSLTLSGLETICELALGKHVNELASNYSKLGSIGIV